MSDEFGPDQRVFRNGPRSWREATQIVRDAAARLQAGDSAQGEPQGMKLSLPPRSKLSGLKVADFGVARFVEGDGAADSVAGAAMGSPAYMSPERCRGQLADGRADLYALTCKYYELLTGDLPFKAEDAASLMYEHCFDPFPDAAAKVGGLPAGVGRVLARGSEKEPSERYQSVAEMVADLNTLLETDGRSGELSGGKRLYADVPVGETPILAGKRKAGSFIAPLIVGMILLAVIVGVGAAVFRFLNHWDPGPSPEETAKPVAGAAPASPRYEPISIPATQVAVSADPARSVSVPSASSAPLPVEKAIAVPEPRDVAAYLRGLGITDKQMLERGALLRAFDFSRPIPPDEWPTLAALMNDVEYVTFHNQSGTDEAVAFVAKVPFMRRLSLDGEPVTDKGCGFLKGHPFLERLDLAHTAISGAAIADLASIPNLTALDLRKTAVRGACWKPLMQSRVSSLWVGDNPIEDRDLADLAEHPALSMVQLSNTRVTDAAIDTLASMPRFRQGDFVETRIDDAGVAKLSRLQNLVTLELSGCPIGENGLVPLAKLKNLRRLAIKNLPLSDQALEGLAGCSQLEGLDLSGCRFNASGMRALSRLAMLRWLRIGGAKIESSGDSGMSRRMLDVLKRKLPNLVIEGATAD